MLTGLVTSVGRLVRHIGLDWNISTNTEWIAMKFGKDIHGAQRIHPNDFGDLPTFHLVLSSGIDFS